MLYHYTSIRTKTHTHISDQINLRKEHSKTKVCVREACEKEAGSRLQGGNVWESGRVGKGDVERDGIMNGVSF